MLYTYIDEGKCFVVNIELFVRIHVIHLTKSSIYLELKFKFSFDNCFILMCIKSHHPLDQIALGRILMVRSGRRKENVNNNVFFFFWFERKWKRKRWKRKRCLLLGENLIWSFSLSFQFKFQKFTLSTIYIKQTIEVNE